MPSKQRFNIHHWGRYDYLPILEAMQQFTKTRQENTPDVIWLVEHNPVYTLGQRAILSDIIQPTEIPIISTDRGGRVTYHGPGQLVVYPLLNLNRLTCHLRMLVSAIEKSIIQLIADYNISAYTERKAPGVYIKGAKVASLGLRIRKGYCYHGLAINVEMDLTPFNAIYPCGFKEMNMTQLVDWIGPTSLKTISDQFLYYFSQELFKT